MDTQFLYVVIIVVLHRVTAQYSITPSSSYAVKNRELHITCNIGPSSPVPSFVISWRRNDRGVASVQSSNCQTYQGTGGKELYQRYTYNCTSNRSYNLYISATQINSEDGSVWRCEDNDPSLGNSSGYTLIVYDPPTADPVISGYSGTTTYLGNTVTLTCTLDGGKPFATLTWICKGVNVQGVNANTQTSAISRYTVTIDTSYNRQTCTCTASHQIWSDNKQVHSQPFVVHFPPTTNPVVSGYDGTFRYRDDIVTLTCTVSGGSPPATLSWTCNGQQQSAIRQSTSGTTVTSDIRVTMKKELNGKTCTCHGKHSDTRYSRNVTSYPFIVYFPPTVQAVLEQTSITKGQTVYMYCLATGVPDHYTYGGWVQKFRNTIIRSGNDFILPQNQQNLTLAGVTHQDIGTYRCKAHNTITDKYGVLFQHGMTNLDIKFSAVFNSSRKFHTELNKTYEIRIPIFLNPVLQNVDTITLTKQNISQKERPDIKISIGTTTLDIVFYGKAITVEGQEVKIEMIQFKSELQGNYTIGIQNYDEGSTSYFVFEVMLSSAPEHPKDFKILSSTTDSVAVTWLAGNNGGHPQTFVISYQQKGKDETLKTKNVTETVNKINYTSTISNLKSNTEYNVWIYAFNIKGNSKLNLELPLPHYIATAKIISDEGNMTGTIVGIAVALSIILVVVGVMSFILLRKRRSSHGTNRKDGVLGNGNSNALTNDIVEEEEDGMRINILYESTGVNFKKPGAAVGAAYSNETRGNKSGVDNTAALYAEIQKKTPPVYPSAVQKSKKKQKDGTKSKKRKEERGDKKDKAAKVSKTHGEIGMLYENVENVRQHNNGDVNMYPSAGKVPGSSTGAIPKGKQSKPKTSGKRNTDGLIYVELELQLQKSDKKPVIHGSDNRTDYADVDFSGQATPFPPKTNDV